MSESTVKTKEYKYNLLTVGQTICVPIAVNNDGGTIATGVIVKLKNIPDGVEYQSSDLSRGEFDINSKIWLVGSMNPKEQNLTGMLCFVITDDSKAPFTFNFQVSLSDYCETFNSVEYCVSITGLTCNELASCGLISVAEGKYEDDEDAGNNGVDIDKFYELSATNLYGLPEGHIKRRIT